jgi:hypothetical protein
VNATSLLAPLSIAAARVAELATSSKAESEEADEPSSQSRPSATASPPPLDAQAASPASVEAEAKPKLGKIRTFLKKYGAVGVVTYFGLYGATLASFYGAYSSGLLFAGDVVGLIEFLHLGDLFDESLLTPKVGNFALAWVSTKFTEPLRFAITLGITPAISRWWTGHHQHKLDIKKEREEQQRQKKREEEESATNTLTKH